MKNVVKFITLIIALGAITFSYLEKDKEVLSNIKHDKDEAVIKELETREIYLNCMEEAYKSETLEEDFNKLFAEYKNEGVAIYFTELKNDYSYSLNPLNEYYSASVVKLFDAIYLIENAKNGSINLDNTITYLPSDQKAGSHKTSEHEFYDEIPLKNLINYAISVSDNAAHFMLVKYINAPTLNLYFKNNGDINLGLTNKRPFSYVYNAKMANESLKRAYDIIKENDEYSTILKDAMDNDYTNALNFEDVKVLHKYGWYDKYFHDIGIYDGEYPYFISILTLYGKGKYEEKVQSIHKKINAIYNKNLDSKKSYCLNKAI